MLGAQPHASLPQAADDLATLKAAYRFFDKTRPVVEKESQKWLTSLEAVIAARAARPDTHFISVGDR